MCCQHIQIPLPSREGLGVGSERSERKTPRFGVLLGLTADTHP
jgi:hypothetical protein